MTSTKSSTAIIISMYPTLVCENMLDLNEMFISMGMNLRRPKSASQKFFSKEEKMIFS